VKENVGLFIAVEPNFRPRQFEP